MKQVMLVSSCLLGLPCRYDGRVSPNKLNNQEMEYILQKYNIVPVCPEQLGGLPTPRIPAEILCGKGEDVLNKKAIVVNRDGVDVTKNFVLGAESTVKIARITQAKKMLCQSRSPSCSCREIYDGTFSKKLISAMGVTAAYLSKIGVELIDIEEIKENKY